MLPPVCRLKVALKRFVDMRVLLLPQQERLTEIGAFVLLLILRAGSLKISEPDDELSVKLPL